MEQSTFHQFLSLLEFKKNHQLKSSGLNYAQLHVLEEVFELGEARTLELSRAMSMAPSTLIGILDELEKRQLITRERQHNDKRVVIVRATVEGKKKVEQHFVEDNNFLNNIMKTLSYEEQEMFFELMHKIATGAKQTEALFE